MNGFDEYKTLKRLLLKTVFVPISGSQYSLIIFRDILQIFTAFIWQPLSDIISNITPDSCLQCQSQTAGEKSRKKLNQENPRQTVVERKIDFSIFERESERVRESERGKLISWN